MTSWSKGQFKRNETPASRSGEEWKSKKKILTKAQIEEHEEELKEYIRGSNTNRTKTKTG